MVPSWWHMQEPGTETYPGISYSELTTIPRNVRLALVVFRLYSQGIEKSSSPILKWAHKICLLQSLFFLSRVEKQAITFLSSKMFYMKISVDVTDATIFLECGSIYFLKFKSKFLVLACFDPRLQKNYFIILSICIRMYFSTLSSTDFIILFCFIYYY